MSELRYKQGAIVELIEQVQKHGEYGWENHNETRQGTYHSCDKNGIFAEVVEGSNVKLYHYPFNLVSIKLEK